jgi:hypothetical protein
MLRRPGFYAKRKWKKINRIEEISKIIYKKSCLEQATVSRGPAALLVLKIN